MTEIKIKIEKKTKKLPEENQTGEVFIPQPSMTDVTKGKKETLVPMSPKVIRIQKVEKKQSKGYLFGLLLIIVSLVVLGLIVWFRFFANKDRLLEMIPERAVLYVQVEIKKAPDALSFFNTILINKAQELASVYQLNFKDEILPNLGNQFAFTLLEDKDQILPVVILESKDKDKLKDILHRVALKDEEYNGFRLSCNDEEGLSKLCFLNFDNLFILTTAKEPLYQFINTKKSSSSSLTANPLFKDTLAKISLTKDNFIYFKPDSLAKIAPSLLNQDYLNKLSFLDIQKAKIFALAFLVDDKGINFEGISDLPNKNDLASSQLINFIPKDALASISGSNLAQSYLDFKESLTDQSYLTEEFISNLEKTLQVQSLNLEKDLISWMNKGYQIIIFPFDNLKAWKAAIVFELDDQNLVKEKLKLIEQAITSYYAKTYPKEKEIVLKDKTKAIELLPNVEAYQFSDVEFEGIKIRTITNIDSSFLYAFLDNKLVLANSLEAIQSVISTAKLKDSRLLSQENFKTPYSKIPKQNNGELYIDIEKLTLSGQGIAPSFFKNFIGTYLGPKIKGYLMFK